MTIEQAEIDVLGDDRVDEMFATRSLDDADQRSPSTVVLANKWRSMSFKAWSITFPLLTERGRTRVH